MLVRFRGVYCKNCSFIKDVCKVDIDDAWEKILSISHRGKPLSSVVQTGTVESRVSSLKKISIMPAVLGGRRP